LGPKPSTKKKPKKKTNTHKQKTTQKKENKKEPDLQKGRKKTDSLRWGGQREWA